MSSVNTEAADLVAQGADVVVMLVHEGAPTTNCATMNQAGTAWGDIVNTVSPDVDAIVSGHTHLAYNCSFPVPEWAGRAVTDRPVVSAGQYGTNLNQLLFTVDSVTGDVSAVSQTILPLESPSNVALYPADPTVAQIAADAAAAAEVLGAQPLGQIGGEFNRAKLANGTTENRGGESTLGNLVAEVQRWATEAPESGSAEIAFMNPGGLRADMIGTGTGSFPRTLTFKQAALVQPFANTLVNMDLTGAQIKTVLEQQWQPRDSLNRLLTRPFLRLGVSEGFEYTYSERIVTEFPLDNPATPDVDESLTSYQGRYGTVTGMWLNGVPIDPAATYSVTVNSFLATGGDNFFELNNGTGKRDTGKIDLTAMVDYMAAFAGTTPLPVDYEQHAVDVTFPAGAPATYLPTSTVTFDVKSWAMSTAADAEGRHRGRLARRHRAGELPRRQHDRHGDLRPLRHGDRFRPVAGQRPGRRDRADPHGCDDGHVGHGADHDREGRVHGHRDRALGDQAEEGDRADLGGRDLHRAAGDRHRPGGHQRHGRRHRSARRRCRDARGRSVQQQGRGRGRDPVPRRHRHRR